MARIQVELVHEAHMTDSPMTNVQRQGGSGSPFFFRDLLVFLALSTGSALLQIFILENVWQKFKPFFFFFFFFFFLQLGQ